jgi:hypothetical protein
MKSTLTFVLSLAALSWLKAGPAEDVTAAAKKLSESNYTYTSETARPEGARWGSGTVEGKVDKDTQVIKTKGRDDQERITAFKGENSVSKTEDGWKTMEELMAARGGDGGAGGGEGRRRMGGMMGRMYRLPSDTVLELAKGAKELKVEGDAIVGELTEAATKERMSFGRGPRPGGENSAAPTPRDAKVSVKFWLKDGALTKYEVKTSGSIEFNGESRDIGSTQTVEIKDVGSTKLELPEDAMAKLNKPADKKPDAPKPDQPKPEEKPATPPQ